jgi:GntR family transcriptional regulator
VKGRENKVTYLQVAEYIFGQILRDNWLPGDKIPGFRELAKTKAVNINTVQHALDHIRPYQVLIKKRGLGYFVEDDAKQRTLNLSRERFINNELPVFFKHMVLLGITIEEVIHLKQGPAAMTEQ